MLSIIVIIIIFFIITVDYNDIISFALTILGWSCGLLIDPGLESDKGYYSRVEDSGTTSKMHIITENYKNLYKIPDDWIYLPLPLTLSSLTSDFLEVLCSVQTLTVRNFHSKNPE